MTTDLSRPPTAGGVAPFAPPSPRKLRIILAALTLSMIMASLDQSIVDTALPRMASDLGGLGYISWVVSAFMLVSTVSTPLYGKLSDMYGRRRLFGMSISLFLGASLLCGTAQTMPQLILFRALQGLGAGGLLTLSQTIIGDLVSPRERARYQGLFTGAYAVSVVMGPLIGGILTTTLSWRWVFFVNLPIGGTALVLILIGLERTRASASHRVDYAGAFLLIAATTTALLMLSLGGSAIPWRSRTALAMAAAAAVLFALFVRRERRAAEPIIELGLFRGRGFAIGVVASGTMAFAMLGTLVFLPLYFQLVLGLNPASAGLMLLPQIGAMMLSSVVGGQLSSRFGLAKPFLILGVGVETVALTAMTLLASRGASVPAFLAVLALLGFGMGIGMPNAIVIIQNAVGRHELGVATATMSFVRSLGAALGVALSGGVMSAHVAAGLAGIGHGLDPHALIEGGILRITALPAPEHGAIIEAYRMAIASSFSISGGVMMLAFLLCLALPGADAASCRRRT